MSIGSFLVFWQGGVVVNLFGFLAVMASLSAIFVGTSLQIRKNWKRKSCVGLSLTQWIIALICNVCWGTYGYYKGDLCLILTNPPSMVLVSVILWQFFIYKPKNEKIDNFEGKHIRAYKKGRKTQAREKVFSGKSWSKTLRMQRFFYWLFTS